MNSDVGTDARKDDTGAGPDTSRYVDYLVANRDFAAPAVSAAVAAIPLPEPDRALRILDAGTGGGGALPELLAVARRSGGTVLAVDADARAIEAARDRVDGAPAPDLDLRVADLRDVAGEAATAERGFDLIWSSDVVWPATFEDPAAIVRALAGALAPGGVLALFTTNYYQSMFLPGHSRLERLVRTASELTWGLPVDGPTHYERLGAWMRGAGLADVALRVLPLAAPSSEPAARTFLEQIAWPEMRHAAASHGRAAGMDDADLARAEALLDPDSAQWVGSDPDAYVVQPTILWTGRAVTA
ncbi:bifunctional 2-polyprenyl-6-hydroxyphenol methylase/3-demethylubiquinol 3-O-methyltransferase UbiG [Nocardiopsis sp. NRRL B-16309]|uniref:class I SAM-dependent methyltransferase n=1 Tax=Nocardiopsis sp. NRRL B-16309 TaxID=1519494 RepID=UPI000B27CEE5|nr:class I SAM-dependent methyltransferase [Nocardiopsis sp. NRRL B-16309]